MDEKAPPPPPKDGRKNPPPPHQGSIDEQRQPKLDRRQKLACLSGNTRASRWGLGFCQLVVYTSQQYKYYSTPLRHTPFSPSTRLILHTNNNNNQLNTSKATFPKSPYSIQKIIHNGLVRK